MAQTIPGARPLDANILLAGTAAALSAGLFGMALDRQLFEVLFPRGLFLGRPLPAAAFGLAGALLGWLAWKRLARSHEGWAAAWPFLPGLLNAAYLVRSGIDPVAGPLLLATSVWLTLVLLTRLLAKLADWPRLAAAWLLVFLGPIYLLTLGPTVGTADTFEFQVVVPRLGIVHPTGYPLFLLLSKPFTWLPLGTAAWRVNLATAVFALLAIWLLFWLGHRLTGRPLAALLAAAAFGLAPTFWTQAVTAEVYSLHALVVAAALGLMVELGGWRVTGTSPGRERWLAPRAALLLQAAALGLGLTNHLTTIILLPPAALTVFFAWRAGRLAAADTGDGAGWQQRLRLPLATMVAFLTPLSLYAYLPIRWSAVNGEAMGLGRFVDWVIGGRFQDALQLGAWLNDATRYEIVGRLLWNEWQPGWMLLPVALGAAGLLIRRRQLGLVLLVTWLGYVVYALNYYVPDLSVFLIPAHLIMAVWWATGLALVLTWMDRIRTWNRPLQALIILAAFGLPLLVAAADTWAAADGANRSGRTAWARGVLNLPMEEGAAILADSDKFPGLYYLQQAEGIRPDLDIMVLPDETAYRAELDGRLAAGQPVYLARYLPGLEGGYFLRSLGPLTVVDTAPLASLPANVSPAEVTFGPASLLAFRLALPSPYDSGEAAVTLYWRAQQTPNEVFYVYLRWVGAGLSLPAQGQHPANNTYPSVAWRPGEIVADYHALSFPVVNRAQAVRLQVALGPPFAAAEDLAWENVTETVIEPPSDLAGGKGVRLQAGALLLERVDFSGQIRPEGLAQVTASGYSGGPIQLQFALQPDGQAERTPDNLLRLIPRDLAPFVYTADLETLVPQGDYQLMVGQPGAAALCGWLARPTVTCSLGPVQVSGQPLPSGATNFDDQVALLALDIPETSLAPGSQLAVQLTWQALASMERDYTVFVQVLDANDRIVGQVDSWPLQGTYPTSMWQPGEIVSDPYLIQLNPELPPGPYKLHLGLYLLETLRRLPVLNEDGQAVDDKLVLPGLAVPAG